MSTWKFMQDITMANAISGDEKNARKVMRDYMKPFADSMETDNLGSLIATKKGPENSPKIMVASHLDEVGFIVTHIYDDGTLKFQTIGGWWGQNMLSQRVTVMTREGKEFVGIIGSKPPHVLTPEERNKPAEIRDMYVDLGVENKEELLSLGVRTGDSIVPYFETLKMANEKYLLAKAWDNRAGCVVTAKALELAANKKLPNTFYSVSTVQEEVGLRGAQTSAFKINPDIAFAVDVCIGKSHGLSEANNVMSELGKGPALGLFDAAMLGHRELRYFVEAIADENNIPYQHDVTPGGGTDGGRMHLVHEGVPTINISIPSRYIHSNVSIVHEDDMDNAAKLIVAVLEALDKKAVEEIKTPK